MNEYKITDCLYQKSNPVKVLRDVNRIDGEDEINEFEAVKNHHLDKSKLTDGMGLAEIILYIKEKQGNLKSFFVLDDSDFMYTVGNIQKFLKEPSTSFVDGKDYILSPLHIGKPNKGHWVVAVISKDEISVFDSTLQTTKQHNNKIAILGRNKFSTNYLNKKPIQDENGTICGLCSAEFIIEASKCKSLKHLKDNMDIICNNVAANVIETLKGLNKPEEIEKQLTKDFQNNNKILLLRGSTESSAIDELRNVSNSQLVQQIKNSLIQAGIETDKQRQSNKQQTYSVQTKERVRTNSRPPKRKQPSTSISRDGKQ